jgi:hypothetical protein
LKKLGYLKTLLIFTLDI